MNTMAIGTNALFALQTIAKFVQRDFLQLTNAFPGDAKFLTNLSEGFGPLSAEPKA